MGLHTEATQDKGELQCIYILLAYCTHQNTEASRGRIQTAPLSNHPSTSSLNVVTLSLQQHRLIHLPSKTFCVPSKHTNMGSDLLNTKCCEHLHWYPRDSVNKGEETWKIIIKNIRHDTVLVLSYNPIFLDFWCECVVPPVSLFGHNYCFIIKMFQ